MLHLETPFLQGQPANSATLRGGPVFHQFAIRTSATRACVEGCPLVPLLMSQERACQTTNALSRLWHSRLRTRSCWTCRYSVFTPNNAKVLQPWEGVQLSSHPWMPVMPQIHVKGLVTACRPPSAETSGTPEPESRYCRYQHIPKQNTVRGWRWECFHNPPRYALWSTRWINPGHPH
jgi:hypothetical protein